MKASVLGVFLYLIGSGLMIQAMLAGLFISGTNSARTTHVIVGAVLPYLAIIPAVSAWQRVRTGTVPR